MAVLIARTRWFNSRFGLRRDNEAELEAHPPHCASRIIGRI